MAARERKGYTLFKVCDFGGTEVNKKTTRPCNKVLGNSYFLISIKTLNAISYREAQPYLCNLTSPWRPCVYRDYFVALRVFVLWCAKIEHLADQMGRRTHRRGVEHL